MMIRIKLKIHIHLLRIYDIYYIIMLAYLTSQLPYSADLFGSFGSLYLSAVFHNKSNMRNMKEIQPGN